MIAYAFKNAELTARQAGWWGGLFSRLIAWKTGGIYSHVEMWLSGPQSAAVCFSSREGSGCGFRTLDLTDTLLWAIVPWPIVTEAREATVIGFCLAMNNACVRYDYLGILGIGTGHGEHDDHDRFCSEVGCEVGQVCLRWWPEIRRWMVSPSDLYKMAKEKLGE